MQPIEPTCLERNCKHFGGIIPISDDGLSFMFFCDAFPPERGGIPDKIVHGEDDHSTPIAGQVGNIVFERSNE